METEHRLRLLKICVNQHYDEILNYMNLHVNNKEEAKDLVQDTFLLITKNIHTYQELSSIRTWCFSIAKNVLIDFYRKKGRIKNLFEKLSRTFSLRQAYSSEEYSDFKLLLKELTYPEQELIILKHYFGFTYKEIAEITNVSETNVGVKLNRAIARLNTFKKEGEENEKRRAHRFTV